MNAAIPLYELSFYGIQDPGVPNSERVTFRAAADVNLSEFGIALGWLNDSGTVVPLSLKTLWLGNVDVSAGSWVLIYTGDGKYTESTIEGTADKVHVFHWGAKSTYFNFDRFVPFLFTIGRTQICIPQPKLTFNVERPALKNT